MSLLRVDLPFGHQRSAVVQLVDEQLAVRQQSLAVDESTSFDVSEGSYLLRTLWSDGRKTQRVIEVPSAGTTVVLEAPAPKPSWEDASAGPILPTAIIYSTSRGLRPAPPLRRRGGRGAGTIAITGRKKIESYLNETGMVLQGPSEPEPRLWRQTANSEWEERPIHADTAVVPGGIDLNLSVGDSLHLIEVRSGRAQQFLALPAEQSVVSIRSLLAESGFYTGVEVRTMDEDVEALKRYVRDRELAVARVMAPEIMAERFLREKVASPRVAALGAYVLLRVGDLKRLHDWPDNLAKWQPWLPDGPLIAAWQRLRANEPNYDEAFELLMEATHRGLPIYTEGVRLLKDGLDLFANDDERDWDVADALAVIGRFGKAMDWSRSETTFFGDAPDRPRLGARLDQNQQKRSDEAW